MKTPSRAIARESAIFWRGNCLKAAIEWAMIAQFDQAF